jgi:cyclophilin family peptidyl-prolyl cis-trans isomerase
VDRIKFTLPIIIIALAACNRPLARFTVQTETDDAPASVSFLNESENADRFNWDFGDGKSSDQLNPIHNYKQSGDYMVTLTAYLGKKNKSYTTMVKINPPADDLVEIQTPVGNMLVKLYNETPQHRDNFIKLVETGYYDSLIFHRVISGFMIQGGDPDSRDAKPGQRLGMGSPGYQIPAEIDSRFIHKKGALAAARTSDQVNPEKKSSGSQFYIVQGEPLSENQLENMERRKGIKYTEKQRETYMSAGGTPFLDMEYTVFGEVMSGLEVIDSIGAVKTDHLDRPEKDIRMKMTVVK